MKWQGLDTERAKKEVPKILIVDDINMNVEILDNIISHEGYETMCAMSVKEAIELIKKEKPTLILSDLSMPEVGGLEFCRMLKSDPATRDIPFIVISVLDNSEEKKLAFLEGAVDFIPKPYNAAEVVMRVNNQLNSYYLKREMADYNRRMHKLVGEQEKQLERGQKNVLLTLVGIMGKKDVSLGRHLENVGYNCRLIAQGLQFVPEYEREVTDEFVETIEVAAKLHAVGSLVASEQEWVKDRREDNPGSEQIKKYTDEAVEILEGIGIGQDSGRYLSMAVRIARYQYANWDGSGCPEAKGKEIPLEARILAVADDFDILTGTKMHTPEEGMEMLKEKSGVFYEPAIVEVFHKIRRRIRN